MKISLENLYADIGALRVKRQMCTCAWKMFDGKTGEENRANKSDLSSFFSARSLSGACRLSCIRISLLSFLVL